MARDIYQIAEYHIDKAYRARVALGFSVALNVLLMLALVLCSAAHSA